MPRSLLASACLGLCACAATEARLDEAFGQETDRLAADAAPADPEPLPGQRTEAELRSQLARAEDPTESAILLARRLEAEERQQEALFVLDTALRRRPTGTLLRAERAAVLRDLGRRGEALAVLEELCAGADAAATAPPLLFELAELQWLEGRREASRATLDALRRHHAAEPWTAQAAPRLAALEHDLETAERPTRLSVRDLLGNLRGAAAPADRQRAFDLLASVGGEARARAHAVILADEDPLLRARGVALAEIAPSRLAEFCASFLADPAPLVRAAAAGRTADLSAAEALALLLPSMAAEESAEAFLAMNAALRHLTGSGRELTPAAAEDAGSRAAVVAEWRRRWER